MRNAWLLARFFVTLEPKKHAQMKKVIIIPLLAMAVPMLMSHTGMGQTYLPDDKDSTQTAPRDTAVSVNDTLREVEVKAKKELRVLELIGKSIKNKPVEPKQKSVSDIIGKKATDYIMNPTAWRERRKEKNLKRTKENLKRLDAAKTFEDELTEAINRQLREDSIAAARKKAAAQQR